ncbi:ABC transporter permease subunit [Thiolinea disciformis]|uniref:ABC transporter permease subunit n=1 Tax=Thiolinea disciformis TaxID=125614 RepID=UPI00036C4D5D|nr:ABC transporter permease subunit [Thiolinea disciformis]
MDLTAIPFFNDLVTLFKPALFNIYFALASIPFGFPFAILLALAKTSSKRWLRWPAEVFIYAFRGSPLFIQFFMFYSLMLSFNQTLWKPLGVSEFVLHPLFIGPIVLVLNTSAYAAEIFYGALRSIPKGEIEAARATGMNTWQEFWVVKWPNMLRLAWPAYTNEVVFLFHATALVYFTLPVIDEQKDLMNKASELFKQDYALFVHFSAAAVYFLIISMLIFWVSSLFYKYLTRHLNTNRSIKLKPNYLR